MVDSLAFITFHVTVFPLFMFVHPIDDSVLCVGDPFFEYYGTEARLSSSLVAFLSGFKMSPIMIRGDLSI